MRFCRGLLLAACLLPGAALPAAAQWGPSPQAQPQQEPPCIKEFTRLRDDAAKKANAIRIADQKKNATPKEACGLFNAFSAAEGKMLKYASDNSVWCGIPAQIIAQIKAGHAKTLEIRTKVCQAAAQPQRPAGPTLSDALGAPITDSNNIKTGRGTFDTLTGTPLGK